MILYAGYNGFHQVQAMCPSLPQDLACESIEEFLILDVPSKSAIIVNSWSEVLYVRNNIILVCGFSKDQIGVPATIVPPFKDKIIQAAISRDNYVLVLESGKVWLCSRSDNSWREAPIPAEVVSDEIPEKIMKVSCGETMTAAISKSGIAYCLPNVFHGTKGVIDVACGKEHGLLLTDSGLVLSWGSGSRGQLGQGSLEEGSGEEPLVVEALAGLRVVRIAAGGWHSMALTSQGDLYSWGWNKQGQLGLPSLSEDEEGGVSVEATPRAVDLPDDAEIEELAAGASHTILKLRDGRVLGCGWNKWGQLGLKGVKRTYHFRELPLPPHVHVSSIAPGAWSTALLLGT